MQYKNNKKTFICTDLSESAIYTTFHFRQQSRKKAGQKALLRQALKNIIKMHEKEKHFNA